MLLVVLLLSLLFVHREMEKLSDTDDVQSLQTDSLLLLLKEKDENTIRMLQIINEANESMITPVELDSIIAEQDTVITQQRVQHRIITKRDSVITKRKKRVFQEVGRGVRSFERRYGCAGKYSCGICDRHHS